MFNKFTDIITYTENTDICETLACVDTKRNIYTRWISKTLSYESDYIHIIHCQHMILVSDNMTNDSRYLLSKIFPSYKIICSNSFDEFEEKKLQSKQVWANIVSKCIDEHIPDDIKNIIINNCLPKWQNITIKSLNLLQQKPTEKETLNNNNCLLSLGIQKNEMSVLMMLLQDTYSPLYFVPC